MFLAIHTPYFGHPTVESHAVECESCGANTWEDAPIEACDPGQSLRCGRCGMVAKFNWGLMAPDHLSAWLNPESCEHFLCKSKTRSNHAAS